MNSNFKELLRTLGNYHVRFLVVGGYAFMKHAEPRYTKDLDVWIATDQANSEAVFNALRAFGAPLANLSAKDFASAGFFYTMGNPPVRMDILMSITGVEFEEAWPRRVEVSIEDFVIPFIAKADLIIAKRAAGRPQDLIDADLLEQAP